MNNIITIFFFFQDIQINDTSKHMNNIRTATDQIQTHRGPIIYVVKISSYYIQVHPH